MKKIILVISFVFLFQQLTFSSPSLWSTSGLVIIPSAKQLTQGGYTISFSKIDYKDISTKCNLITGSFGLMDFIEVGIASLEMEQKNKMAGALKYKITRETGTNPGVGIGAIHLPRELYVLGRKEKAQESDTTYYVVVSQKLIWPREFVKKYSLHGHLGYGEKQVYDGLFGGLEVTYSRFLKLLFEYDTKNINFGANFFISPGIVARGVWSSSDFWGVGFVVEVKGK